MTILVNLNEKKKTFANKGLRSQQGLDEGRKEVKEKAKILTLFENFHFKTQTKILGLDLCLRLRILKLSSAK